MSLLRFLFPRLLALDHDDTLTPLVGGLRLMGRIIVLPHRYYSHARRQIPRGDSKGRQAARAQAIYESSYDEPDFLVRVRAPGPHPSEVSIWSWDRDVVKALTGSNGTRVIPEPLVRTPMQAGARLVEALEGFEGEIWADGKLIASRWWPEAPDDTTWHQFMVGARSRDWPVDDDGRQLSYERPEPSTVEWNRNLLWVRQDWWGRISSIGPAQIAAASLLLGAGPAGCEASRIVQANSNIQKIEAQLTEQKEASEPWLNLRRRALSDQARVSDMSAPGEPVALVFGLIDLDVALGNTSAPIERLDFQDGELRVTLAAANDQDVVAMVSSLEQSSNWDGVRYDAAGRQLIGLVVTGENTDPDEAAEP